MTAERDLLHLALDDAERRVPGATAIRDAAGDWTYRQLARFSREFAAWLVRLGIGRGDRILVQLPAGRRMAGMLFGVSRAGGVFVPVNPATKAFHLRSIAADADPALVVTSAEAVRMWHGIVDVPVVELDELTCELQGEQVAGPTVHVSSSADPAVLIYTSGSTGTPKAVVCPHRQVMFACRTLVAVLGYHAEDVVFCRFPLSWDYGLYKVLMTCLAGCTIVLADGESDLRLLGRMRETGTTVVPIVPSFAGMILRLARRERGILPPIRMFTNTGAALAPAVADELSLRFPGARVIRQYGQTEAKRITVMPPEEHGERPGSVGRPLPGTHVSILDPHGGEVPVGEIGEIVVSGPNVMDGYWRNSEATRKVFRRDEADGSIRLHTGDYGFVDEDGYLYFHGRHDEVFKRKGIRMSTVEIEHAATDIPGVEAAAVLPPGDSHDLAIFVESTASVAKVLDGLRERLEPAKVPVICRVVAALPRTVHGKSARQALARLLERGDP
ncbi:AMP-binding protein [Amycolatopsis bartoniae]|uniref:AMP-dependent ligase n=1 Tax=Amycolatopsis bartoniae TaxID=941986 RepID=A0A8H9IT02_9PSEU|nr:AMP-binding protein [Amycolatopsis bartoniae]TVT08506.1 AMP-binding protein [Amycolatopsis bartoniae]GHF48589.1 AMP-dependent ligase [Amycolatopsis bartoniae]